MSSPTRFRTFHGRRAPAPYRMEFHVPRELIHLGRAVAVIYESDKRHGGGDGRPCEYIHHFEPGAHLYMDETGKKQLYILSPYLKVTSAGIEH